MAIGSSIGSSAINSAFSGLGSYQRYLSRGNSTLSNVLGFLDPVSKLFGDASLEDEEATIQQEKDLMDYQSSLEYALANQLRTSNLVNSPSEYRQGLEKAGYNPMLAVTNGVPAQGATSVNVSNGGAPNHRQTPSGNTDLSRDSLAHEQFQILKSQAQSAKAIAEADVAESSLAREYAEAEHEALQNIDSKGEPKGRADFKQGVRNRLERSRYENSREHAIGEDIGKAIGVGASAYQMFRRMPSTSNPMFFREPF